MRLPKTATYLLTIVAVSFAFSAMPTTSQAQDFASFQATYKVQVEYWFFDTDYYYWSTVLETDNRQEAEFVYGLLLAAAEDNELNNVARNFNWRYIAVDVRLTTEYSYPRYLTVEPLIYSPIRSYAK